MRRNPDGSRFVMRYRGYSIYEFRDGDLWITRDADGGRYSAESFPELKRMIDNECDGIEPETEEEEE